MERRIISPVFVYDALEALPAHNVCAEDILRDAGLPSPVVDPITSEQFGELWWTIADKLDDEFFGLASRPMRRGAFELMCRATMQSRNLEQALRRTLAFMRCVIENPSGELQVHSGEARIIVHDPEEPRSAFAYRTYWLFILGVASWLVGRQIPLRRFEFACPPPDRLDEHSQLFGAPVHYGSSSTELIFNSNYLRWPVVRTEKSLAAFIRKAPGNLVVRYRHEQGLGLKIRERLNSTSPADWPRIEELAADLNMSSATLRRQLSAEGRSIGGIKDEIRQLRARRLLEDRNMTVADVATTLGYSEPSAFHRAHRKWTGRSPRGD